jgi:DNA ligase-associated metallophosphoesterase
MQVPLTFDCRGETVWLSPGRCLFLERQKALVLSDLHFGKTGHFRKSGIAVPQQVYQDDLHRLLEQVHHFQPEIILFTGDLFHSDENREHELFARWRESIRNARLLLVRGNHDRLTEELYTSIGIELHDEHYRLGPFGFIHDIGEGLPDEDSYWLSGHVHPGIRLHGPGKQSLAFPCFHFTPGYAILPAFSRFTGLKTIRKGKKDHVFAIVPTHGGQHTVMPC